MTALNLQCRGSVATVRFGNSEDDIPVLDSPLLAELSVALGRIESDPNIERVIFTSAGARHFLVGPSIDRYSQLEESAAAQRYAELGSAVLARVASLKPLTVASIAGHCIGPGFEFALACDARVAADDSDLRIGPTELLFGLVPPWGGVFRLVRRIGPTPAMTLIGKSLALAADAARSWGLVDALAPRQGLAARPRRSRP